MFLDPVRVLNESYSSFRLSPSLYYSRLFKPKLLEVDKKRKRKGKGKKKEKDTWLNERELRAEQRHQEVRALLLEAHRKLLEESELVKLLEEVSGSDELALDREEQSSEFTKRSSECNFVELGSSWRVDFCEISPPGLRIDQTYRRKSVALFNNVVKIDSDYDIEAEFQNRKYILPQRCSFLMSDLKQLHKLIPENYSEGFNLIVIDPPWENASARQKSTYPTLPNKHFLYLPINKLVHSNGALVALWVTNREKFQDFVFNELFPFWGVTNVVHFYWLKDFNSECVKTFKQSKESRVIISIPGAFSRKPPLASILL